VLVGRCVCFSVFRSRSISVWSPCSLFSWSTLRTVVGGAFSGSGSVTVLPNLYRLSPVSAIAVSMLDPWIILVGMFCLAASSMSERWVVAERASPPMRMPMLCVLASSSSLLLCSSKLALGSGWIVFPVVCSSFSRVVLRYVVYSSAYSLWLFCAAVMAFWVRSCSSASPMLMSVSVIVFSSWWVCV